MRTRTALFVMVLLLTSLTFFSSGLSPGAAQDAACEPLIQAAFETLNASCGGLAANAACFGSSASAIFADGADEGFSQPGDQVPLSSIQSIHTQPLNTDAEEWGLALLNVHANVPLALSEQGLKYILIGDVEVENGVDAASAFTPVPSLTVTPLVAANLRSAPSTDARILGSAEVGTELLADGLSSDSGWLRVMSGDQVAWISRQTVAAQEGDIDSLPVVGSNTRTLMQSIFLRMGDGDVGCAGAPPSMLMIQAPGGVNASITVNGVDLRFDGTIALHISDDNRMQFIVLSGGGNAGGVSVPAGFTLNIPLSDDGRSGAGGASGLRPINDDERTFLTPIADGISADLLYTALTIPTQEQINEVLAGLNASAGAQVVSGPASGAADCGRFKPTSPLSGMVLGVTPFYWDAAPGATAYRINVFAGDGSQVASIDTGATSTTFQIDTNTFGGGSNFSWSVDALVNGQVACSSGRVNVVRDAFPQFVSGGDGGGQAAPTACSWQGC